LVFLVELDDPDASMWRLLFRLKIKFAYLPHRNFLAAEEEDVNLLLHVAWLLHINVVVEEVFDGGDESKRLQLLTVSEFVLAGLSSSVLS
jgi:hypothetical protein